MPKKNISTHTTDCGITVKLLHYWYYNVNISFHLEECVYTITTTEWFKKYWKHDLVIFIIYRNIHSRYVSSPHIHEYVWYHCTLIHWKSKINKYNHNILGLLQPQKKGRCPTRSLHFSITQKKSNFRKSVNHKLVNQTVVYV